MEKGKTVMFMFLMFLKISINYLLILCIYILKYILKIDDFSIKFSYYIIIPILL